MRRPTPVAERLVDVAGQAHAALAVAGGRGTRGAAEARPLGHPVDDPAAAAAAEDHRVGAAQHLDPVDIVEVAEILDVVADAVDEEVGGGVVAAQRDLVAIALAGAGRRAGDEGQHVGDRAQRLVLDLAFGNHRQRLRDVLDVGVGAGRGAGRARLPYSVRWPVTTMVARPRPIRRRRARLRRLRRCRRKRGTGDGRSAAASEIDTDMCSWLAPTIVIDSHSQ